MMVIAVGAGPRIARVLPELGGLLTRPLLTLERVRICKRDGELLCAPALVHSARPALPRTAAASPVWHKLMVYTSEAALHDGQPVHRTIVRPACIAARGSLERDHPARQACGASTVTTRRTATGCCSSAGIVPAVTVVIDSAERIAAAFAVIDELTAEHGLVTSELVPAMRQR